MNFRWNSAAVYHNVSTRFNRMGAIWPGRGIAISMINYTKGAL